MIAGFLVWLLAGVRVLQSLLTTGPTVLAVANLAAWLFFLAAFLWHVCAPGGRTRGLACLAVQSVCALFMASSAGTSGMEVALFVMVAGQLPLWLGTSQATLWVLTQTLLSLLLTFALLPPGQRPGVLGATIYFGAYVAFQLFALGTASLAESERTAREGLAAAHTELERVQSLAIDGARQAERLRIARDLHDSLGHRLTALGLTLEAARHLETNAVARTKLNEARDLSTALLSDLRAAVGEIRDDQSAELRSLLSGLARSVQSPLVRVSIAPEVRITNPEATTAIFRMAQEIVTNAVRHAKATELHLTLKDSEGQLEFTGVDDGHAEAGAPGNGLAGIQERAQLLGGDAEFGPLSPHGFKVSVRLPASRLL